MNNPVLGAKVEKRRRSLRGKGQTMAERQFESDRAARPEQGQHMPRPGPSTYERSEHGPVITFFLPWPDSEPAKKSAGINWTPERDEYLRQNAGKSAQEIAKHLGTTASAIRNRRWRLGITDRRMWTSEEEAALRKLYSNAEGGKVIRLAEFANEVGRDKANVCRKAKEMGLAPDNSRRKVEVRKARLPKYQTTEELKAAQSKRQKEWLELNGHPRGFLGGKHSQSAREAISEKSRAANERRTEEEKSAIAFKAAKTREANGVRMGQNVRKTWKAGWREIGGKRNFYRSRWEANYARYLQWLKERGEIADWQHEPQTFWFEAVKRGTRSYLPDFRVWENNGSTALHEVKGWMDDRSRVCLKRMAKYYPNEKIILIDGAQYRAIRLAVMRLIEGWEDSKRDTHA